jgi:hypothetical protein
MMTICENGRDNSGHSGQGLKHWVPSVPTHLCQVGTTRDKETARGCHQRPIQASNVDELDSSGKREQPMSRAEAAE